MPEPLHRKVPDLATWDGLEPEACAAIARDLAGWLPPGWSFTEVRRQAQGDQSRSVAFFDFRGSEFALIPGGPATLGYDRSRPPIVNEEDCQEFGEQMELAPEAIWPAILAYLDGIMTPLRTSTLAPFLAETAPRNFSGARTERGWDSAFALTLRETYREIHRDGFRLATSDEWEYACGAGSRTFWRWGHGDSTREADLGPNAFGLHIAQNSYDAEWCVEPDCVRGGDGGEASCGGEANLIVNGTLATAYRGINLREVEGENFLDGDMIGPARRILTVPPP